MRNLVFYAQSTITLYQGDIAMRNLVVLRHVNHYGCIRAILQCVIWCFTPCQPLRLYHGDIAMRNLVFYAQSTITLYQGDIAMRNLVVLLPYQPFLLYQGDIAMRNLVVLRHVNHYGCIRAILQCVTWCFTPCQPLRYIRAI